MGGEFLGSLERRGLQSAAYQGLWINPQNDKSTQWSTGMHTISEYALCLITASHLPCSFIGGCIPLET